MSCGRSTGTARKLSDAKVSLAAKCVPRGKEEDNGGRTGLAWRSGQQRGAEVMRRGTGAGGGLRMFRGSQRSVRSFAGGLRAEVLPPFCKASQTQSEMKEEDHQDPQTAAPRLCGTGRPHLLATTWRPGRHRNVKPPPAPFRGRTRWKARLADGLSAPVELASA